MAVGQEPSREELLARAIGMIGTGSLRYSAMMNFVALFSEFICEKMLKEASGEEKELLERFMSNFKDYEKEIALVNRDFDLAIHCLEQWRKAHG